MHQSVCSCIALKHTLLKKTDFFREAAKKSFKSSMTIKPEGGEGGKALMARPLRENFFLRFPLAGVGSQRTCEVDLFRRPSLFALMRKGGLPSINYTHFMVQTVAIYRGYPPCDIHGL